MSNQELRPAAPPRFQFSLQRMLIVVTAVALLLGFSSVIGETIAFFAWIILYTLPAALAAAAVYGRGDIQAFAIGGFLPCIPTLLVRPTRELSAPQGVVLLIQVLFAICVCGAVAVVTRRFVKQLSQIDD